MPEKKLRLALDPMNPGQFFAACGLFELLDRRESGLLACFILEPRRPRSAFMEIQTNQHLNGADGLLCNLRDSGVEFPGAEPEPVRPVSIAYPPESAIELDWWLDEFHEKTTNLKCWAGQVTTKRLFTELMPLLDENSSGEDIFERNASTTSLFGLDPRSAWNTLDLGFSPNEHGVASTVFPAVEVLAAIGLQYFRPESGDRSGVHYSLWLEPLPVAIARLAFARPWDGLARTDMVFEIAKRGQSYKYFSFARNADKETENR